MNAALWLIAGVGIATVLGLIAKFRTQPTSVAIQIGTGRRNGREGRREH